MGVALLLKGIERVVSRSQLEIGKFYSASFSGETPNIIQIIRHDDDSDEKRLAAVYPSDGSPVSIGRIPSIEVYAELPNVSVRIDPMCRTGSSYDKGLSSGMLIVSDQNVILLAVPPRQVGWGSFSITDSETVDANAVHDWCSFSSWKLVVGEGDDERTLYASP